MIGVTDAAPRPWTRGRYIPPLNPRDGVPVPIGTHRELTEAARRLASRERSAAVDAEKRASGYRYGHDAYLVQIRRVGAGTALIDPMPFNAGLSVLNEAIADAEWVLHAATQDLPCLADLGMAPQRIFDTELAGRLLGYPRVGLATLVEELLGYVLEKGHSAADWFAPAARAVATLCGTRRGGADRASGCPGGAAVS